MKKAIPDGEEVIRALVEKAAGAVAIKILSKQQVLLHPGASEARLEHILFKT